MKSATAALAVALLIAASAESALACEMRLCNDKRNGAGDCQRAQSAYQACLAAAQNAALQQRRYVPPTAPMMPPAPPPNGTGQVSGASRTWDAQAANTSRKR